jgi:hydrogenase expression/formation protein HypC
MCLGIPGRITQTWQSAETNLPMGQVDFGGVRKEVCLSFVPEAKVGDYVIVHVGFAISLVNAAEAQRTLDSLAEAGVLAAEGIM